jgi:hypothetical protein
MAIQNGYGFVHYPLTDDGIDAALRAVEALHQVTVNNVSYDCSVSNQLRQVLFNTGKLFKRSVYNFDNNNFSALPAVTNSHRTGGPSEYNYPAPSYNGSTMDYRRFQAEEMDSMFADDRLPQLNNGRNMNHAGSNMINRNSSGPNNGGNNPSMDYFSSKYSSNEFGPYTADPSSFSNLPFSDEKTPWRVRDNVPQNGSSSSSMPYIDQWKDGKSIRSTYSVSETTVSYSGDDLPVEEHVRHVINLSSPSVGSLGSGFTTTNSSLSTNDQMRKAGWNQISDVNHSSELFHQTISNLPLIAETHDDDLLQNSHVMSANNDVPFSDNISSNSFLYRLRGNASAESFSHTTVQSSSSSFKWF